MGRPLLVATVIQVVCIQAVARLWRVHTYSRSLAAMRVMNDKESPVGLWGLHKAKNQYGVGSTSTFPFGALSPGKVYFDVQNGGY
jgi:hypothetical protein